MRAALAYFLTWTTYATRLHGDPRGTVSRRQNRPGTPTIPPDADLVRASRKRTSSAPMTFRDAERAIVASVIREHAMIRGWCMLALNVRTNHVHAVVGVDPHVPAPERVMGEFKLWATRRLREARLVGADQPVWATHGSTRWLDKEADVRAAIDYVERMQDAKGA